MMNKKPETSPRREKLAETITQKLREAGLTLAYVAKEAGYPEALLRNHMQRNRFIKALLPRLLEEAGVDPTAPDQLEERFKFRWINENRREARKRAEPWLPDEDPDRFAPDRFLEIWILSAAPKELRDAATFAPLMQPLLISPTKLVYFIGTETDARLLQRVWQTVTGCIQNVHIVICPAVQLMPHWAILFENDDGGVSRAEAYVEVQPPATAKAKFIRLPDAVPRRLRRSLADAGLLGADFLFAPSADFRSVDLDNYTPMTLFWSVPLQESSTHDTP